MSTDGTTAIPVSPVAELEPDMRIVFNMLTRAANAIVQSSDLSKTVARMESEFEHVKYSLDVISEAKASLEERLQTVIAERNERSDLAASRGQTIHAHELRIHSLESELAIALAQLDSRTIERDEARASVTQLGDKLAMTELNLEEAENKLAKFREILGIPHPQPEADKPVPEVRAAPASEPTQSKEPEPKAPEYPDSWKVSANPPPAPEVAAPKVEVEHFPETKPEVLDDKPIPDWRKSYEF
jgi:hypothetical protein